MTGSANMSMTERKHLYKQMSDAGIGKRFHEASLTQFGKVGEHYITKIQSGDIVEACNEASGVSVYGDKSYDFSILLLKALLLRDMTVCHLTLAGLARAMNDWDFAKKITKVDCLLITKFCNDVDVVSPIDKYQRMQIEDLLQERWDNGYPVFVQSNNQLATYKDWWSKTLIRTMGEYNEVVEAK